MNWFAFLSPGLGNGPNSARRNSGDAKREPRDPESHVRAFLPHLARLLQDYAATFNQSAADQLQVDVHQNGNGVEGIHLRFNGSGFAFRPTGKGAIQVDQVRAGELTTHALLRPRLNRRGVLLCWREQPLSNGGGVLRRTADELCEYYILHTVRASLVGESESGN